LELGARVVGCVGELGGLFDVAEEEDGVLLEDVLADGPVYG